MRHAVRMIRRVLSTLTVVVLTAVSASAASISGIATWQTQMGEVFPDGVTATISYAGSPSGSLWTVPGVPPVYGWTILGSASIDTPGGLSLLSGDALAIQMMDAGSGWTLILAGFSRLGPADLGFDTSKPSFVMRGQLPYAAVGNPLVLPTSLADWDLSQATLTEIFTFSGGVPLAAPHDRRGLLNGLAIIPEPSTALLLALAACGTRRRRS